MDPSTDKKADYLLRILETIGAPLMTAITDAAPPGEDNPQNEAQTMAALLGKTVEASIDLGQMMQIDPAQAQDDTLRVALAGLAGPLVAGEYAHRKRVPESPEIKKITSALQAVLTFSDNFTPTPQTVERLQNLEAKGQASDTYQTQIQYMQAFIPVVEAIAQFPFGQAEAKLIMDVSNRIINKSVELRETLLPNVDDEGVQKLVELGFVRALGELYCACHKAETEKATGMDQDAATSVSIDAVWKAFDLRTAMMEALAAKMVPAGAGSQSAAASGGGPSTAPPQEQAAAAPATPPPATPPPATPPATPPPAETQPPAQPTTPPAQSPPPQQPPSEQSGAGAGAGGNPMSMFAKKPEAGADSQTPSTTPPPSQTPPPTETPQAPPAAPPTQPPPAEVQPPAQPSVPPATETAQQPPRPQQPPQQPPQQQGEEEQGEQDQQGQGGGGSPMSFFKKDE